MIDVKAQGYVNKPESKVTKGGKPYSTFTLSVKQKDKAQDGTETVTRAFYNVTNWKDGQAPEEGSWAKLGGFLKVRQYEDKNGIQKQALDIICQELEVSPPKEGIKAAVVPEKDPWE